MEDLMIATYLSAYLVYLIIGGAFSLVIYALHAYIRMQMGKKAGIGSEWQAWVPFAQEVYLLKMAGVSAKKIFFIGNYKILVLMLLGILAMITTMISAASDSFYYYGPGVGYWIVMVLLSIIEIAYLIFSLCVEIGVYKALYGKFNGTGSFHSVAPYLGVLLVPAVIIVADALIAFNKNITYGFAGTANGFDSLVKKATITGMTGFYAGQSFDIEDGSEVVFGRDPEFCNVIFGGTETAVSRKHCAIKYIGMSDTFLLTVYSKNGVICDGNEKVEAGSTKMLRKGSVIALGTETNKFILG